MAKLLELSKTKGTRVLIEKKTVTKVKWPSIAPGAAFPRSYFLSLSFSVVPNAFVPRCSICKTTEDFECFLQDQQGLRIESKSQEEAYSRSKKQNRHDETTTELSL